MGGSGSGEKWSKRRTVESCTAIDTADLKRLNMLSPGVTDRPGSLEWRRRGGEKPSASVGYTLTVGERSGTFRLQYRTGQPPESLDYPVRLVTTPCHLGGVRWWFVCPLVVNGRACNRRVRKLYLCCRYFGCRRCHGLAYTSSQESDSRVYALLRAGLGGVGDPAGMSVTQLGIALKALTIRQKRIDRWLGENG
jgi:hypothetical protein